MDSYNLFGDDGSGMLEGLTDLGGTDGFPSNAAAGVTGDTKDTTDSGYRQPYNQGSVGQESSLQKLSSFGGGSSGLASNTQPVPTGGGGPAAGDYHEYAAYGPRPRPPQPPHAALHPSHPSHHGHPTHYPGYHPGPDPMYGIPDHTGIGDMGVWTGAPGPNRYSPITPAYRHSYDHQQKMHQYPPQQGPGIAAIQSQNGGYLPRQPHFPQPPSQPVYGQQQNYPSYTQMHPPASSRINQHPSYHQQMEVNSHQYGIPHSQQTHGAIPQHQPHQNMGSHQGGLSSGIQGHPNIHLHHAGAPQLHHGARQPPAASSVASTQMPYAAPHHTVSMNYQPHQVQHPLDVNVASQYNTPKPAGLETGSPQYRPPFHQISPQVSPRAQMSPRQQAPPQSSPRPVISPVKGPSASPHGSRNQTQPPVSTGPPAPTSAFASQNTLQALEQMVLPAGSEYPFQRNPSSPAMGQWNQNKVPTPLSNVVQIESTDPMGKPSESPILTTLTTDTNRKAPNSVEQNADKLEKTHTEEVEVKTHQFILPANVGPTMKDTTSVNSASDATLPKSSNLPAVEYPESHVKLNLSESDKKDNRIEESKLNDATISDMSVKDDKYVTENVTELHKDKLTSQAPMTPATATGSTNTNSNNIQSQSGLQQQMLGPNNMPRTIQNHEAGPQNPPGTNGNRSQSYSIQNNSSATGMLTQGSTSNLPSNMQSTTTQILPSLQNTPHPMTSQGVPSIQTAGPLNTSVNMLNPPNLPLTSIGSNVQPTIPTGVPNMPTLQSNMQQNITNVPCSIPPNIPPSTPQNMTNVPVMGIPLAVANTHPNNMPPNLQTPASMMPTIQHNINPNMMMLGPNTVPHNPMPGMYPPSLHHQERSKLQQQIQEIYCLPPSAENQEKVRCLQERLALLQQHETNDKCSGGPNCVLQNTGYGSKMVESPQVTSTTGRGRGKGQARPRKPRAKKEKPGIPTAAPPLDQLPVSEDCVTAGTGIQNNSELDVELSEDTTNLDSSIMSLEDGSTDTPKKQRLTKKGKERKPRTPKVPKEVGENSEKPVKERKKREPKDPNAPKRKRNTKKDGNEIQADTTTNYDIQDKSDQEIKTSNDMSGLESANNTQVLSDPTHDNTVTDFDDIPVSKIAIKDLLEEAEAKRELAEIDDDNDSLNQSCKRKSKKRSSLSASSKKVALKKVPLGRKRKRGGLVPDSDGEPDDMMSTPPPSPPAEGDDSLKRRSARHTQRKKYTDDVLLRLSDDEFAVASAQKREKEPKAVENRIEDKESTKADTTPKPNYMYVNTAEEDSMIVQFVLACRMGKRELKNEPIPAPEEVKTNVEDVKTNPEIMDIVNTDETVSKEDVPKSELTIDDDSKEDVQETVAANDQFNTNVSDSSKKDSGSEKVKPSVVEVSDSNENVNEVQKVNNETLEKPESDTKMESSTQSTDENKKVMVDVEEYYVKYRNFSYLHCEWKTEEELYKGDKRIFSKIKRFKQKQAQQLNIFELLDDEPFNPDYIEVERILDVSENVDPGNDSVIKHYLVKWKSLQYEDSTWELEEDIDVEKITQFKKFVELPPKDKWKYKKRPSSDHWEQLNESPLYKGGNTLRPYQLEGLNWLLFSWHNNRNCILADEMGLGKTIQSLTFVNSVWEYGIRGPFLIIAPLSTIPNWQREFEGWTEMNVIVYHGSQQSKSMIQEYEFYYKNQSGEPVKEITKFNVLITTFEMIVTDFQELKNFNWRVCVIDEAHRLKNRNCKLLEGLRQLHLEHRVLLSGTPLQNNVNELFSLLNFLEPSQFASNEAFLNDFGQLKSESEVLKLQALLKPMMLRRLKEDVEKSLAPKEETIIEVELTNIQKKYYRAILERNFSFLTKGTTSAANIPNLMNTMMELRKCCIHPYLLNGAEDQIQFDYKQTYGEDKEAYYKALIQSSGKMVLVDKLLPKLKAGGHRVLIFSQMVRCLDILEDYLLFRKYPFERIDGRIRGNLRQEAIDRFSKPDSDRFVFLLCTKAGGLGINLTAADTVIIYDSDWNPQNDLQAQARCHRIGQQKMVKIYRLICRNSYEREMFDKASLKLGLDKAILQSMNTTQGKETNLKQLSKKEIEDLLKKGAYGAVMDEDNAGDKFCEEDIEMILARRTQVIQMESEKGSTFSKASFAAANQRSDIDIRDPDFWNKWAKKAEIDTTEKKEDEDLIVTEPRKRNVIKRYGHDDGPMEMSDMEVTPDSEEDEEGISLRSKRKKDKFGKKGRKYASDDYIPRHEGVPVDDEVVYGSWTRSECFKIERGLLTFGWARWEEIIDKNQFRKGWTLPVIEDCARIIVLYCLRHYKGDEKIRNFIWDLIEPCENGEVTISRNHSGLHNPVPRGRNAKKKNRPKDVPKLSDTQKWEDPHHWSSAEKYDCEAYLESSYKKHLFRHANKVLLRVRMMYYIKHEVIGDYANKIENGVHASALGMRVPRGVDSAPPRLWWDTECDVSLLVGTYVHGYENYLAMRSDPQLCYVDKLGPPDDAECTDIKSEERKVRGATVGDEDCTDEVSSGAGATSPAPSPRPDDDSTQESSSGHQWPSMQDLNTRLRRLITAYQRNYKREELKMQQKAKMERRDRLDQFARDEASQWRWTRADEEAFRRTVASYGVEFDPTTKSLRWGRFRALARLDSKSDDALTDYLKAFMAMCKRQCGLSVGEAELPTRADLKAEPIGEERAIATLERIDLLRVLREEVAPHPALETRLALCERAADAPPWWQPARHDHLLVVGVCKHGLGDTYNKLFCDPKLPFTDCANKWYSAQKSTKKTESQQVSSDEEEDNKDDATYEPKMSLRRSKRNSNTCDREVEDTDALSELETLAKLGRNEESLPANHWFSERALETRLHHIAHAVQKCEWPTSTNLHKPGERILQAETRDDRKQSQKRHIAIDVETERAKLHALLSSPRAAHTSPRERTSGGEPKAGGGWERDDASSDSGSRRSTPAPPPAHQRPSPAPPPPAAPAPAPVDLSAPLDLSEAQDFSRGRRTPAPAADPASTVTPAKSRLDESLSRLMKRKNVPAPEPVVGKEKKRKKLDEIVLGLSAAKGQSSPSSSLPVDSSRSKSASVLPNVSVTPVAPPSTSTQHSQKPFSVTVTNVPSPQSTPKELSSFLQQSLEQSGLSKGQKASATQAKSFSHEAKVNKWLAEQASVDARRRVSAPRLSPDEHVPVVHRVSGKRLVGNKAPQLKHLAQWIAENPMYDIDPKWTEGIKEHVKLPQDVRSSRHSPMQSSSSTGERKKGRPPSLDAASNVLTSNPLLSQNLAGLNPALLASLSAFDPKTLASTLSSLTGFDPKLLNTFDPKLLSSLGSFDPKNNPLLSSFNSMPNLLGGNLFANLAGLGLPGLSSLDMSALGGAGSSVDSKNKSRKSDGAGSSGSKASNSQFPFVFPNPNMLYPQLGLGGMNPFGMHSGMSSAYDTLGLLSSTSSTPTMHSSSHTSARGGVKSSTPKPSTVVTSSSHSRHQKSSTQQSSSQLPQIFLPPDTYLLESLSKHNYDALLKAEKQKHGHEGHEATDLSKVDKKKMHYDSLRSQIPPEFAAVQEKLLKGDKKDIDISKMLLEQMASGALSASLVSAAEGKKAKESDNKELFEKMSKTSSEYVAKALMADDSATVIPGHKRTHDEMANQPENLTLIQHDRNANKKMKEEVYSDQSNKTNAPTHTGEMDLEDLIAPSTVIKTGVKPSDFETNRKSLESLTDKEDKLQSMSKLINPHEQETEIQHSSEKFESAGESSTNKIDKECDLTEEHLPGEDIASNESGRKGNKKKGRKSSEEGASVGPRRELRSSASRQSTDSASHSSITNS